LSTAPVDLSDIHARLLSIEEKMAVIADDSSKIRVQGFERITRLETRMEQLMTNDIPHLQKDVDGLKQTLSPRNLLLYAGGISTLIVTATELARTLRIVP
jgi:hypothetical protein